MQNFSSLALDLREEFEMTDRQTVCCSPKLECAHRAKIFRSKISYNNHLSYLRGRWRDTALVKSTYVYVEE